MISVAEITKILQKLEIEIFGHERRLDKGIMRSKFSTPVMKGHRVGIAFDISGLTNDKAAEIRLQVEDTLKRNFEALEFSIIFTSNRPHQDTDTPSQSEGYNAQNKTENRDKLRKSGVGKIYVDGVNKVILVSSGKGGVGKSTVTSLLASGLRDNGKKVGILDADIYGPSIPKIFGTNTKPELDGKKMLPVESFGIQLNSIGFITASGAAISWRGPMVSKALYQLLSLTKWQEIDYLLVDMPPGTGDIHISLMENYMIDGALLVTTPQMISALDVERSLNLYKKFNTNIIGVIENMSFYCDPNSGARVELFSGEAGKSIASQFDIDFLGELEILPGLSDSCDYGKNLSNYAKYLQIAIDKLLKL